MSTWDNTTCEPLTREKFDELIRRMTSAKYCTQMRELTMNRHAQEEYVYWVWDKGEHDLARSLAFSLHVNGEIIVPEKVKRELTAKGLSPNDMVLEYSGCEKETT